MSLTAVAADPVTIRPHPMLLRDLARAAVATALPAECACALAIIALCVAPASAIADGDPAEGGKMGIILGVAVLLDALLVRLLLMPVMLRVLGRWAWYLPKPLGRLLPDVRFGHA